MQNSEQQLAIIKDIVFQRDPQYRYDAYFTNKRVAIIGIGKKSDTVYGPGGIVGGLIVEGINAIDRKKKREQLKKKDEQISDLSLDALLGLNGKKSCFYTYDEIEEIKLIKAKQLKLVLLSGEFETELSPDETQFNQLGELLPRIEALKGKVTQ